MAETPRRRPRATRHDELRKLRYGDREVTIREGPRSVEVEIDGVAMQVSRLAPGSYHSQFFTHQEFPTAEALVQALVDTEGTLWLLRPPEETPRPHEPGHPHG